MKKWSKYLIIFLCISCKNVENKKNHIFERQIDSLSVNLEANNYKILSLYDSLLKYNNKNVLYNYGKAKCLINMKDYNTAISEVDKGLKIQDENISLLILKSMLLKKIGKVNEYNYWINKTENLLKEKYNNGINNRNNLIFVLVLQGKKNEAITLSNKIEDISEREYQIDFINSVDTTEFVLP